MSHARSCSLVLSLAAAAFLPTASCAMFGGEDSAADEAELGRRAPVIATLSPTSGDAAGGTRVVATGSKFQSGATVFFDSARAPTTFVDPSRLEATSPPHAPGEVKVTVKNPDGSSSSAVIFTYAASSTPLVALPGPSLDLLGPPGAPDAPGERFPATFGAPAPQGAPTIAAINETVFGDESFTLTGARLSARSGLDAGSDTTVWVGGITAAGFDVKPARVWSSTDKVLTATVPAELGRGMFLVWVENANGASEPVALNRARAQWLGPLGNVAAPGARKRVFGRNLSVGHGTSASYVYLRPAGGSALAPVRVTAASPFAVEFEVPPDLVPGTYDVFVHNGGGGACGWSAPLPLTVASPWVRDAFERAVAPSGGDDAPALQAAVNEVSARAAGGTVRLAPGRYVITRPLQIGAKVRLAGAGRDSTAIEIRFASAYDLSRHALIVRGNDVALDAFTLALVKSAGRPKYGLLGTEYLANLRDIQVTNLRWTADAGSIADATEDPAFYATRVEFANNVGDRPLALPAADNWIHDNLFHGGPKGGFAWPNSESALSGTGASRLVVEKNHFETPAWSPNMPDDALIARRILACTPPMRHTYLAHNTTKDVATTSDDWNKGEIFLFHGGGGSYFQVASHDAASGTTTVRADGLVDGVRLPSSAGSTGTLGSVRGAAVAITSGTGTGQVRRIAANTTSTFTVDAPWRVAPAADSKLATAAPTSPRPRKTSPTSSLARAASTSDGSHASTHDDRSVSSSERPRNPKYANAPSRRATLRPRSPRRPCPCRAVPRSSDSRPAEVRVSRPRRT